MPEYVSLREHFEALLAERDRRYEERFEASMLAIAKAETATEKRFESVNEFRAAMNDQGNMMMPRDVAEAQVENLRERIEGIKKEVAGLRESRSAAGGALDVGKWIVAQTIALIGALGLGVYLVAR